MPAIAKWGNLCTGIHEHIGERETVKYYYNSFNTDNNVFKFKTL